MSFEAPQALLLAVPLLLLVWKVGRVPPPAGYLRWAMAVLLPLALARPVFSRGGNEIDVVVVVDRSRSMPAGSDASAEEIVRLLEQKRGPGQRVGVVTFGREARVERSPSAEGGAASFQLPVDGDASDLAAALTQADDLIPQGRAGRVLVLSDGRATGGDARAAARRLALRGIAVDYRLFERPQADLDVAVKELTAPASLAAKEPFQLTAVVTASRETEVGYVLTRSGTPIAKGRTTLHAGENRILFRDRLEAPGLADYRLSLEGAKDPVPENDRGRTVVRIDGPPRVLLMRADGQPGALAKALRGAGLTVDVVKPTFKSLDALEGVSTVVLENVTADELGDAAMRVLDLFVRERGGGLVLTGGESSFGQGGYHRSALDPLLPVSMELRQEQRKSTLALVITMDRSGSMSVPTPDGRTKISLAGEGAVAALQLLSPGDEAGVWVVDTKAHEICPLTPVEKGLPLDQVAGIQSMGGGIYIYEALESAALEIDQSDKQTRHILLFADAADSEEPGDYQKLLADLAKKKITVSVIGMGRPTDSGGPLLEDIARLGGGRIYFAEDVASLPRVFAQETITVARSSFVDGKTPLSVSGDLALLGPADAALNAPPQVGGYNLTYLKSGAGVAYRTADENKAPLVSLWERGLGHVVAVAAEADGPRAAALQSWPGYGPLFSKLVRWSMAPPEGSDALVRVRREGHELVVVAEVDPTKAPAAATVTLLPGDGQGPMTQARMSLEEDGRLAARFPLPGSGTFHPVVKLGGELVKGAPATLPYPPEFEPQAPGAGRMLLAAVAQVSGGIERLGLDGIFDRGPDAPGHLPLAPALVTLLLAMMLTEVLLRRFFFRAQRVKRRAVAKPGAAKTNERVKTKRATRLDEPGPVEASAKETVPLSGDKPEPEAPPKSAVTSAIDEAMARAKKRTGR